MDIKLAYYKIKKIEESYMGGVMICDISSLPLEFKYTEAIKPTKIHKIIFGKVLERYISEELIEKKLFKELKYIPTLILCESSKNFGGEILKKLPTVAVQETTLPALSEPGEVQSLSNNERDLLIQSSLNKHPCKLTFNTFDREKKDKIINLLKEILKRIDIVEPFERLNKALDELHKDSV